MRKQTGCIYVNGNNWCLRWREGQNGTRQQRFKILTAVTSEHRKNRERKTGKLRIPDEVQAMANAVIGVVNSSPALFLLGERAGNETYRHHGPGRRIVTPTSAPFLSVLSFPRYERRATIH